MRVMVSLVVAAASISAAEPVRAQTYDPRFPVCMQIYGPNSGIDCSFTSMADCKLLAHGRPAQCLTNPYFAQKRKARH